jgi:cyanophycin synthetase
MNLTNLSEFINTNIYLNAAVNLGINYELLEERVRYYKLTKNGKELKMLFTSFSFNDSVANGIAKDKYATSELLRRKGFPVPDSSLFRSETNFSIPEEIEELLQEAEKMFPAVIKPVDMSLGKGVFVNLTSREMVEHALTELRKISPSYILLEKFLTGIDYRILVIKGKVIDVIQRIPAYVNGDGTNNLTRLIEAKNLYRKEQLMPLIEIDDSALDFLKRHEKTLESVPAKDERVVLKGVANIAAGGETKRIPISEVPEVNLKMFEKAAQEMNMFISGIDFISTDVRIPYTENAAGINEVNGSPHPDVHFFADMECTLRIAEQVLASYFGA